MINENEELQLTEDRVMVEQPGERRSQSGLVIIPDTVEKPFRGKVLGVGPEVSNTKVGDEVLFGKYAGTEFEYHGKNVLVMRDTDITAVIVSNPQM